MLRNRARRLDYKIMRDDGGTVEAIKGSDVNVPDAVLPGCWMVEAALNRWKIQM